MVRRIHDVGDFAAKTAKEGEAGAALKRLIVRGSFEDVENFLKSLFEERWRHEQQLPVQTEHKLEHQHPEQQ